MLQGKFDLLMRCHKGGGDYKAPPPPDPPATERTAEVYQAARGARRDARRRKGYRSTLLSGEAAGSMGQPKKTLLG
jgi:hypothetical protein